MSRSSAILAFVLMAAPGVARANSPQPFAVLPIILAGPHGSATLSSVLGAVDRAARWRPGLRMLSTEEMFVASSGGLDARVRDCGSDTECIVERLGAFDARLGLVVMLNFVVQPPLLSLQLLDTGARTLVADAFGELDTQGADPSSEISRRASALLEQAGFHQGGRIVVDVAPPRALIFLEPAFDPEPGLANTFIVPPGIYRVAARSDGHREAATRIAVVPGGQARVNLELEAIESVTKQWWFWAVLAAAVAGGVVAGAALLGPTTRCVCTTLGGVGCELCER